MSDNESTALATRHESTELSVEVVLGRLDKIQDLMKRAMTVNVDYGTIPGTNSKPTLLKPGAEKLCLMFQFAPRYKTEKHFHPDGHLTVESTCQILDREERFLGEASAMCSTREAKYAFRKALRVCPKCGVPAIVKNKNGQTWQCIGGDKGGCWEKYPIKDPTIETHLTGRIPNEDLADSYNTVLRIAEKRAYLGAVRLVTGSSALFDEEIPNVNERDAERQDQRHDFGGPDDGMHTMPHPDEKKNGKSAPTETLGTSSARDKWLRMIRHFVRKDKLDEGRIREAFGVAGLDDIPESALPALETKLKAGVPEWREDTQESEPGSDDK